MASYSYARVQISRRELRALKRRVHAAPSIEKWSAYKAWEHKANLMRWRSQGLHFHYLTQASINESDKLHCTCGLIISESGSGATPSTLNGNKSLDAVQSFHGHLNIPRGNQLINSFIIDSTYNPNRSNYLWDVLCQYCGETKTQLSKRKARNFSKAHNMLHGKNVRLT